MILQRQRSSVNHPRFDVVEKTIAMKEHFQADHYHSLYSNTLTFDRLCLCYSQCCYYFFWARLFEKKRLPWQAGIEESCSCIWVRRHNAVEFECSCRCGLPHADTLLPMTSCTTRAARRHLGCTNIRHILFSASFPLFKRLAVLFFLVRRTGN